MQKSLSELKSILDKENLLDKNISFEKRYEEAVKNKDVREIFDLDKPKITDLTDILQIENNGRLYVIRMDLNKGVDNHKKPVVAGLILRGVLKGNIPKESIDTLIDGGNFNSAKALKYYTKKLGMKGMYVMSRLFPKHIIDILEAEHFHVIQAPRKYDNAMEKEFYEYLVGLMGNKDFRKNKFCLLHAKYGGKASYPFGIEIAEKLEQAPDYTVSCIGAGSTLEGLQIAIQDYFKEKKSEKIPSIIIGEHELSPLFTEFIPYRRSQGSLPSVERVIRDADSDFYAYHKELPHIVIGPHYDEINPLLSKKSIDKIDEVVQYSDHDWMTMQKHLENKGISVGNSSAANLNVAANIANEGNNVLTVIFEPFREFYKIPIDNNIVELPWILRMETPKQKVAFAAASVGLLVASIYYAMNIDPNAPALINF